MKRIFVGILAPMLVLCLTGCRDNRAHDIEFHRSNGWPDSYDHIVIDSHNAYKMLDYDVEYSEDNSEVTLTITFEQDTQD